MVGSLERSAGYAGEVVDEMHVAVGRGVTVVEQHRPGQRRGGERPVLGVGRAAGERDLLAGDPLNAGVGSLDRRGRSRVPRMHDHLRDRARALTVGDPEADGHVAGSGVGLIGGCRRRVTILAVSVEIPGVGDRIAVGIARSGGVEAHVQRHRPVRGSCGDGGDRWLVACEVLHAVDRAVGDVDVVEIPARPDLEVDRRPRCLVELGDRRRIRQAVRALERHPYALARVVGEKQRALVLRRVGAAVVEGEPGDRRGANRTCVGRRNGGVVPVAEPRRGDSARV